MGRADQVEGRGGRHAECGLFEWSQARARVVEAGLKAQDTLAEYSSCSVAWSGSQQLNQGGSGYNNEYYGGGSQVDVSAFGRRTQEQKPLRDSSAVRLTVSTNY